MAASDTTEASIIHGHTPSHTPSHTPKFKMYIAEDYNALSYSFYIPMDALEYVLCKRPVG